MQAQLQRHTKADTSKQNAPQIMSVRLHRGRQEGMRCQLYLEGHRREATEAGKLGQIDEDGTQAGEEEGDRRWAAPVVVIHPQPAHISVQEWPKHQQGPALHES